MADVLLTDLKYGARRNREDGNDRATATVKTASAGDPVPSDLSAEEKQALKDAGVIGNAAELLATLGSTTSVTQSQEWPEAERTERLTNAEPASEHDLAVALRARTDQVARAEGKDPEKVVDDEAKAAAKADDAAEKDTPATKANPNIKQ